MAQLLFIKYVLFLRKNISTFRLERVGILLNIESIYTRVSLGCKGIFYCFKNSAISDYSIGKASSEIKFLNLNDHIRQRFFPLGLAERSFLPLGKHLSCEAHRATYQFI